MNFKERRAERIKVAEQKAAYLKRKNACMLWIYAYDVFPAWSDEKMKLNLTKQYLIEQSAFGYVVTEEGANYCRNRVIGIKTTQVLIRELSSQVGITAAKQLCFMLGR